MTFLIVDDETPARGELRFMLGALMPEADLIEADTGERALELIGEYAPEVVFLDINMPGLSGLDVAAKLLDDPEPPLIVFATAYDEHALKAFELEAIDYLLKPYSEARLASSLERLKQALDNRDLRSERGDKLKRYLAKPINKLWGERENENRVLLDYGDICWFSAEEGRVYAHTVYEALLVRFTLKELEIELAPHGFVRAHKSILVNLDHILELVPWFSGNYLIRMKDRASTQVKLSRRYAAKLKQLTGWR